MTFEPEPGMRIQLDKDETIEFLALESSGPASVFVYAESGKEGTVYKVLKNQELYALKVFYPEYRDKRLLENTERLIRFKDLEGFRVAERNLIEPEEYPELIRQYPELRYSVLMPWIEGTVWGNLMLDPDPSMQSENYLQIAKTLIRVVTNLETQGLAHCDLSNNNFIITNGFRNIQLIDVEDMYAPGMPRPIPDISYGTIGYRTRWIAERGLWGPESDRFSIAILCSEILAWHNQEIRDNRSGNTSFFDEEEIGENSDRYKLMTRYLDDASSDLPELLEKAWFANEFAQCPAVSEWFEAIHKVGEQTATEAEPSMMEGEAGSQIAAVTLVEPEPAPGEEESMEVLETDPALVEDVNSQPETIILDTSEASMIGESKESTEEPEDSSLPESSPLVVDESKIETFAQKKDGTVSSGVPAKMEVGIDILDFGVVGKPENTQQFTISNSGGSPLVVSIQSEEWINVSHPRLTLAPDETQGITVAINEKYPRPHSGREYLTAIALAIESNVGSEVIGARFVIPKPPFFASGWKRALLGAVLGTIFACIMAIPFFPLIDDPISYLFLPAIPILFGVAGFIAHPQKSSFLFAFLGFAAIVILATLSLFIFKGQEEISILILGLGSGFGVFGGALFSRIFYRKNRSQQGGK